MILWLVLFLLVVGSSFILAFRSMKEFQGIPQKSKEEHGLFLIRQTGNLNAKILDFIRELVLVENLSISIERLFKGKKSALTVFGPKKILDKFTGKLDLLELEDYVSPLDSKDIAIWEVGVKNTKNLSPEDLDSIFGSLPKLGDEDQFFWQVILGVRKDQADLSFQTQIRAAFFTKDFIRRETLSALFQHLKFGELTKISKPFSTKQMMDFYRLRSLTKDSSGPVLDSEGVMSLVKI